MNHSLDPTSVKPSKKIIPVFFAVDDNYAPYLAVAIRSLIDNASPSYDYHIYILIKELSQEHVTNFSNMAQSNVKIETVNVSENLKALSEKLHLRDYYTSATYYRFFIPDLFPQYDRALYLDCDIVVEGDVSELYLTPLHDHILGAVADDMISDFEVFGNYAETVVGISRSEYFNAGILLMNLEKMRRIGLCDAFVKLLSQRTFRVAQDQDYLNVLCHGDVTFLSDCWNKNARPDIIVRQPVRIIHYKINWKPWHYKGVRFEQNFWKYAELTPYKHQLYDLRNSYTQEDKDKDEKQYQSLVDLALSEIEKARNTLLTSH